MAISTSLEQLSADALKLTPAERVILADRLYSSVDTEQEFSLSKEWLAEIDRRIKEIDGGMETIPAEEVFAKARAALEQHRNRA